MSSVKRTKRIGEQPGRGLPEYCVGISDLPSDFPSLFKMQELLKTQDFTGFQALKPELRDVMVDMLTNNIPRLMVMVFQRHP